jgi:hypothetical protein
MQNTVMRVTLAQLIPRLVHFSQCSRLKIESIYSFTGRLCDLVVRVSGYRSRGLWYDSRRYHIS